MEKDPVCSMQVDPGKAAARCSHQSRTYYFCSAGCAARFRENPERYVGAGAQFKGGSSDSAS